jgi:serine/threonine-protein kinase
MVNDVDQGVPGRVTAVRDDDGPRASQLVGRSIAGKFVVEALIASGGAGTVYRARQLALDRTVALKVLRPDVAGDGAFVERFKREARAASRLDHPNSVRVFDFGAVDESLLYLAMEYVEGPTLHQLIAEQWPLDEERVVDLMSQVLSAIAVAHDMGVIHRDLKPDNIMIVRATGDDGGATEVAKVCDFGIATLGAVQLPRGGDQASGPWVTMDGSLVGTPGYMSPEQARGETADPRSDIYSAGVILYHLLTGRPPFEGESAYLVAMKHITDAPLPPSEITTVNPALEAVCLRALSKAPRDRFESAREMRAALRAAVARATPRPARADATPAPVIAPAPPTVELLARAGLGPAAQRRRLIAIVAAFVAAVAVVGAFAARSRPHATSAPAPVAATRPMRPATPSPLPQAAPALSPPTVPVAALAPSRRPAKRRSARAQIPAPTPVTLAAAAPEPVKATLPPPAPARVPVAPPAPRIDVERATASITAVTTTSAIPGSSIRAALARVPIARCYRDSLRAGAPTSGTATLRLRIDAAGYVTGAVLQGAAVTPPLKACVEKAATAIRIKDVDTGDATADVALTFVAAP